MTTLTFAGNPVEVAGTFPSVGQTVADFTLVGNNLADVKLSDFAGKRKVLNIFPSIDTSVCAVSVRKFNEAAASADNTVVLCIAADLPFANARFCGAEGIENVITLSTFRNHALHEVLGVQMLTGPLAGLSARAVIVLDEHNKVIHSELVPEIKNEVNYDAALAALK